MLLKLVTVTPPTLNTRKISLQLLV